MWRRPNSSWAIRGIIGSARVFLWAACDCWKCCGPEIRLPSWIWRAAGTGCGIFDREIGPAMKATLNRATSEGVTLVGTGGTTTILARMEHQMTDFDRTRLEGTRLTQRQVLEYMVHLWSMPLARRKKITGLPPNRADVIIMGIAIYEAVMEHFGLGEVYVSTRGLRFGALLDVACNLPGRNSSPSCKRWRRSRIMCCMCRAWPCCCSTSWRISSWSGSHPPAAARSRRHLA